MKRRSLALLALAAAAGDAWAFSPAALAGRRTGRFISQATTRPAACGIAGVKACLLPPAPPPKEGDYVDILCRGTNSLMKKLVLKSFRDKVEMQPAGSAGPEILDRLLAPPEYPGMSRPLWLVMAGSIPTFLGWYGYYKFSVEEELFQDELATDGRVTGCGGYGTLFPFVFLGLIGAFLRFVLEVEEGEYVIEAGGVWILGGQINLYRRINQLYEKDDKAPPLHAWWAALPPPFDLIVGLRQVSHMCNIYE